jgi:gamma-glutamylcyclotransferase (GGCT)/AIG2-like uncharacterized protein YtfP
MSASGWDVPLAVYGTLRHGQRNHALLEGAIFLGTGVVAGAIRHVPAASTRPYGFPVLIPGAGRVVVELYRIPTPGAWVALDALELYDAADEAGSEFLRRTVPVGEGPVAEAQVYVYNGAVDVLGEVIDGGDWVAFDAADS